MKKLLWLFAPAVLIAAGLLPVQVSAVEITLGAGKVSTIFENQPDNSIGRGPAVFVGGDSSGSPRRGLIDFNFAANIPAGAMITSAQLTMYVGLAAGADAGTPDQTARTIELHRLIGDWAHGPTGLGVTVISGTDQGYPAIPPSPTWNERRYQQGQPWTTSGGDFLSMASASTVVGQTVNGASIWLSTPQLVADVQFMLDQPSLGFGWMLVNTDERVANSYRALLTKDWMDPILRPQLLVNYEIAAVPLPGAVWLFGSGALALAGVVRRASSGITRRARSRTLFLCSVAGLLALFAWSTASAETIIVIPNHDATIFGESINQGVPNTDGQDLFNRSNGAGPGLFAGGNGALAPHRALISFDIAGNLPQGAVITDAQLTMYIGIVAGSGGAPGLGDQTPRIMDLHVLTADWGEGITGSTSPTIGGSGQGFPANPGDATWNARHFAGVNWTTPGGDFRSTVSSSLAVGSTFFSPQTWQSTPQLVADVQGWLNDPSSNFGWILINEDENLRQTHRAFYSKEWSDPAQRPQLFITYTAPVPVPAAAVLFATGLVGLMGIGRRAMSKLNGTRT